MPDRTFSRVALFLVLTAAFTAPFWWLGCVHPGSPMAWENVFGLMWGPAAAALCVGRARELGWEWPERGFLVFAFVVPIAYMVAVYGFAWAAGFARFFEADSLESYAGYYQVTELDPATIGILGWVWALTVQMLLNCAYALGEEIGWRGFLVPELSRRLGLVATGVVSGIVWAGWHFPLMLFGRHRASAYEMVCFAAMVTGIAITMAWLRLRSRSVWPAVLFHASHNSLLGFLGAMASDTSSHRWYFGETGLGLVVASAIVAVGVVILDRRRARP